LYLVPFAFVWKKIHQDDRSCRDFASCFFLTLHASSKAPAVKREPVLDHAQSIRSIQPSPKAALPLAQRPGTKRGRSSSDSLQLIPLRPAPQPEQVGPSPLHAASA
jgi:hypothetical protein